MTMMMFLIVRSMLAGQVGTLLTASVYVCRCGSTETGKTEECQNVVVVNGYGGIEDSDGNFTKEGDAFIMYVAAVGVRM